MDTSAKSVRWLAWALVGLAIATAVLQVIYTFALPPLPPPPPETEDYLQNLEAFVAIDQQLLPFVAVQSLAALGVFLVAAVLATFLRAWALPSSARNAMVLMFAVGGALGIAANVLNIAVADVAARGYCDCGYKTEELIARDYALNTGWTAVNWVNIAAVTLTGVGVAIAGRIVELSAAWRTLSYLIAVVVLLAAALRVLAAFVFIQAFDPFQVSDLLVAFAAGILVPIWAILLARNVDRPAVVVEPVAA